MEEGDGVDWCSSEVDCALDGEGEDGDGGDYSNGIDIPNRRDDESKLVLPIEPISNDQDAGENDNPPPLDMTRLIIGGVLITGIIAVVELSLVYLEVKLIPIVAAAPEFGIPLEAAIIFVELSLIDIDVAYWVMVANAYETGEKRSVNFNPLEGWEPGK